MAKTIEGELLCHQIVQEKYDKYFFKIFVWCTNDIEAVKINYKVSRLK